MHRTAPFLLTLVVLCTLVPTLAPATEADSAPPDAAIGKVTQRLVTFLARTAPPAQSTLRGYQQSLGPDGRWPDIDYASQQRGGWHTADHLRRLHAMALAWRDRFLDPAASDSDALLADITRALDAWLTYNLDHPQWCPNWWYNDIFIPRTLGEIGVLMGSALGPDTHAMLLERLSWSKPPQQRVQGANWVWLCEPILYHGLLTHDHEKVAGQFANIWRVLEPSDNEGVQPDFTFHQHGRQQQMGNYGLGYVGSIVPWLWVADTTPFAAASERIEFMRNFLLKGQAWFVQPGIYDLNGAGRQIISAQSKPCSLAHALETMAEVDPAAADQYNRIIHFMRHPEEPDPVIGSRWFPDSLCFVHRRPEWSTSLRMAAQGFIPNEDVNDDDVLSGLVGLGSLFQYVDPADYVGIPEVWNWRRIPGTTAGLSVGALRAGGPPERLKNASSYAGGVSLDTCGAAAMEMIPIPNAAQPIHLRKSWFFFEDAWACLGQITAADLDDEILTTLAQETLDVQPVLLQPPDAPRTLSQDERLTLDRPAAVLHGHTAYVFGPGTTVILHAGPMTGNWFRSYPKPEEPSFKHDATRDVFMLAVSHGRRANANANPALACIVLPTAGLDAARRFLADPWLRILANDPSVQAVLDQRHCLLQAAFFDKAQLPLPGDSIACAGPSPLDLRPTSIGLTAAGPAMVILREHGSARLDLALSDPTADQETIRFTVPGDYSCEDSTVSCRQMSGDTTEVVVQPQDRRSERFTLTSLSGRFSIKSHNVSHERLPAGTGR